MKISFSHKCMIALTVALVALSYIFYFREGIVSRINLNDRLDAATHCKQKNCEKYHKVCSSWNPNACEAYDKCLTKCQKRYHLWY